MAGESFTSTTGLIEIHLQDARQLFHSLDPTPFPGRDLDSDAEAFILSWARELSHKGPLHIRVHLDHCGDTEPAVVPQAIHNHFRSMADMQRLKFRRLLSTGRLSLLIGLSFLVACLATAQQLEPLTHQTLFKILQEGLVIGGWVAMWRPLEIILYDWWPLLREYRLCRRLADARIEVRTATGPLIAAPSAGG